MGAWSNRRKPAKYRRSDRAIRGLFTAVYPGNRSIEPSLDGLYTLLYYDLTVPCGAVFFALVCAVPTWGNTNGAGEEKATLIIE
ncbi:MAG: hypothetical protein JWN49_511 [Parcubacteria group bacterium]|nr:hypothetical protein [Parcubacteria group bacterium]